MDINSASPDDVDAAAVPRHEPAIRITGSEHYPRTADTSDYLARYNTRIVGAACCRSLDARDPLRSAARAYRPWL